MACDGRTDPARADISFVVNDPERGNVAMKFYDRISIEDVVLHFVERELFKQVGGNDPGDDLNQNFKDFLVRENYLEVL